MIERSGVNSSNIKSVGYDVDEEILEIEFQGGKVYRYEGVPTHEYYELIQAESVGKYFNKSIRNAGYPYSVVS